MTFKHVRIDNTMFAIDLVESRKSRPDRQDLSSCW